MLYPKDMAKMGVFMTAGGDFVQYKGMGKFAALQNVVPMFDTGLNTADGDHIWEGDVVDVNIPTEFGSVVTARGFMQWDRFNGKWSIHIPNPPALAPIGDFPVLGAKVAGNVWQHPELIKHGN